MLILAALLLASSHFHQSAAALGKRFWVYGVPPAPLQDTKSMLGDVCGSNVNCVVPYSVCATISVISVRNEKYCVCKRGYRPNTGYCAKSRREDPLNSIYEEAETESTTLPPTTQMTTNTTPDPAWIVKEEEKIFNPWQDKEAEKFLQDISQETFDAERKEKARLFLKNAAIEIQNEQKETELPPLNTASVGDFDSVKHLLYAHYETPTSITASSTSPLTQPQTTTSSLRDKIIDLKSFMKQSPPDNLRQRPPTEEAKDLPARLLTLETMKMLMERVMEEVIKKLVIKTHSEQQTSE